MAAEHSPLPWRVIDPKPGRNILIEADGESDSYVAMVFDPTKWPGTANAAFIVRAVNSHPALVDNARKVLEGFGKQVFVRSTANDAESDWAIKALPYISALAHLEATLKQLQAQAEGREG